MKLNGWRMNIDYANDKNKASVENQIYSKLCGNSTFWGYKYGNATGSVIAPAFNGSGCAILDFGSCAENGITKVYHKRRTSNVYEMIDVAHGMQVSKLVSFSYQPGDVLKLEEEGPGVININSFRLKRSCNHTLGTI